MDARAGTRPLVVVVGETASGKTALALELARRFNGEVICADSRTVYKSMDIGTAKPSPQEQSDIKHHLLDIVSPDQSFNAAQFKQRALDAINDIADRGKVSIMVGGTGLYIDAVIFDFQFRQPADPVIRQELSQLSVEELQDRLRQAGIDLPNNPQNPRHLIRALETGGASDSKSPLRANTLVIGLQVDPAVLTKRIQDRVEAMVRAGFVDELEYISSTYGWGAPGLQAPGYKAFRGYVDGTISLEQAKALFVQNDLHLAKRQRTWFRRNNSIHWVSDTKEAVDFVTTFLSKIPL
ncbi:MAG TPA: tRNA (adenosine(37)-N6)-dimethylallyltransferase MiaA [Verrucomicrobiae bacterium]|nr:tRNA (adenosine(37)-N6)-dimethylallyltransferase MiaA [Verrucomicrobiae bacterium]